MASYYMLGSDGKEYGPVSADQLRQWANDGRANAQTQVRDTTGGSWMSFGAVSELNPPPSAAGAGAPPTAQSSSGYGANPGYAPGSASYAPAASYAPMANDAEIVKPLATTLASVGGWMKFLAVLSFIAGGLYVLSVWGILVAWLPIWIGVVLWGAATKAQEASLSGSADELNASLDKIRFSFKLYGVRFIIGIVLGFVFFFFIVISVMNRPHNY
jgi:hypothetical protein